CREGRLAQNGPKSSVGAVVGRGEPAPETPGTRSVCACPCDWFERSLAKRLSHGRTDCPVTSHDLADWGKWYGEGTHRRPPASPQSACRAPVHGAHRGGHARHALGGGTLWV